MPTPERKFLLKAYDGLKQIANPLRDTYFPNVSTSNLAEIKVDTRKDGKKVALFVSPVKNGKPDVRSGFTTTAYKMPMYGTSTSVVADDDAQNRGFGETINGQTSAVKKMASIADEHDRQLNRREMLMCRDLLINGAIQVQEINEDGTNGELWNISYGAIDKIVLGVGKKWTDTGVSVIESIDEVVRARELISSKPVKVVTLDPLAAQALRNNEADMKKLNIENVKLGLINPKKLGKGHRYIGQITMSGIDIYELQDTYKNEAGVLQNLLPAGTAIFGPGDDEFITGPVSLYAEDTSEEPVTSVKPRVPNVMIAPNKRSKIIETLSRQMPMPADLDAYAVATVL